MNFGVKLFLCAFLLLFYNNCGPQLKSIDQTSSSYTKTQCTGERKVVGTANDDTLVSCENTFSMEGLEGKNTYQFHTTNTVKLKDFNPNSDALDFRFLTEAAQASQGDLIQDYVQLQAGRNYYEVLVLLSDGRFKKIATLGNFPVESTSLTFDD